MDQLIGNTIVHSMASSRIWSLKIREKLRDVPRAHGSVISRRKESERKKNSARPRPSAARPHNPALRLANSPAAGRPRLNYSSYLPKNLGFPSAPLAPLQVTASPTPQLPSHGAP